MSTSTPRALSIGETVGLGLRICSNTFVPLAKAVFFVAAPVALITAVVEARAFPDWVNDPSLVKTSDDLELDDIRAALLGLATVVVVSVLGSLLASAACFRIVAEACLGITTDWTASLRFAVDRLASVVWISVLSGLVILGGLLLCVVPGLWLAVLFSVAAPALLLEGLRGRQALARSRQLVRGRFWPVVGTLLLGIVLAGAVSVLVSSIAEAADPTTSGGFMLTWAAQTAASTVATPVIAAITTVMYLELRVRKEGLDLAVLASELGVSRPLGAGGPWPLTRGDDDDRGEPSAAPPFWPPPPGWSPPPSEPGDDEPGHEGSKDRES